MKEFNYEKMVSKSLIHVVQEALEYTADKGLPGDHFFNITFLTNHPASEVPSALLAQYPKEMTIVLQYEFSNLTVDSQGFSVVLNFSGIPNRLYIPFAAIKFFVDPYANFGLQFEPEIPKKTLSSVPNDRNESEDNMLKAKNSKNTDKLISFASLKKK